MRIIALVLFLMAMPLSLSANERGDFGNFRALIIANKDYVDYDDIDTAVRDAGIVADVLRRNYGFEVELLPNASRYTIVSALDRVQRDLQADDNLLIFYIGHGTVDARSDRGFWLPIDAEKDNSANWIDIERLTGTIKGMAARHVIVVTNFFHDPNLQQSTRGFRPKEAATKPSEGRSRTVLLMGNFEQTAEGDGEGHSKFVRDFVDSLSRSSGVVYGRDILESMAETADKAKQAAPRYAAMTGADHQAGDFPFVPLFGGSRGNEVLEDNADKITPSKGILEEAFWELIKDENEFEFFEAFLRRFPNGQNAAQASRRLSELTADRGGAKANQ